MSRRIAERAASNGGWTAVTAYSSTMRALSGIRGTSIAATSAACTTSQVTMTSRRGKRSASPGQEQRACQVGQGPRRICDRGEQRQPGPVIDQERQGDQGQTVATCPTGAGRTTGSGTRAPRRHRGRLHVVPGNCSRRPASSSHRLRRDGLLKRSGRFSVAILTSRSDALPLNRHIGYRTAKFGYS